MNAKIFNLILLTLGVFCVIGCTDVYDAVDDIKSTVMSDDNGELGVSGRNLDVFSTKPHVVTQAFYTDANGETKIITPRASNRQLVVINVTVVNRTSTVIPLLVDKEAVQIGDRRSKRFGAIDYSTSSKSYSGILEEGLNIKNINPLLWGDVELPRQMQVSGHVVFDVPKGLLLGTVFWDEVEYIPVDFVDYWSDRD